MWLHSTQCIISQLSKEHEIQHAGSIVNPSEHHCAIPGPVNKENIQTNNQMQRKYIQVSQMHHATTMHSRRNQIETVPSVHLRRPSLPSSAYRK